MPDSIDWRKRIKDLNGGRRLGDRIEIERLTGPESDCELLKALFHFRIFPNGIQISEKEGEESWLVSAKEDGCFALSTKPEMSPREAALRVLLGQAEGLPEDVQGSIQPSDVTATIRTQLHEVIKEEFEGENLDELKKELSDNQKIKSAKQAAKRAEKSIKSLESKKETLHQDLYRGKSTLKRIDLERARIEKLLKKEFHNLEKKAIIAEIKNNLDESTQINVTVWKTRVQESFTSLQNKTSFSEADINAIQTLTNDDFSFPISGTYYSGLDFLEIDREALEGLKQKLRKEIERKQTLEDLENLIYLEENYAAGIQTLNAAISNSTKANQRKVEEAIQTYQATIPTGTLNQNHPAYIGLTNIYLYLRGNAGELQDATRKIVLIWDEKHITFQELRDMIAKTKALLEDHECSLN